MIFFCPYKLYQIYICSIRIYIGIWYIYILVYIYIFFFTDLNIIIYMVFVKDFKFSLCQQELQSKFQGKLCKLHLLTPYCSCKLAHDNSMQQCFVEVNYRERGSLRWWSLSVLQKSLVGCAHHARSNQINHHLEGSLNDSLF